MNETDCPTCKFPTKKSRDQRLNEACQFVVPRRPNSMFVPNYGEVPVLKGDLTWLSNDVSIFLNDCVQLMTPSAIRLCNGSVFEALELRDAIGHEFRSEEQKQLDRLHLALPDGEDVDEVHVTTKDRMDAEPEISPDAVHQNDSAESTENGRLSSHYMSSKNFDYAKQKRFKGCMSGRTMYVVPFSMGWVGSRHSVCGVQVTDDPVLILNLRTTFRVISSVWDSIAATSSFIRSVHTIGMPRPIIRSIVKSPPAENPTGSFIVLKHDEQQVWADGYCFGRNFKFGKTFSVHAASWIGAKKGWLAENAAILAITNPKNVTIYVCYSSLINVESLDIKSGMSPGWKLEVVSNKTVWVQWHDGKLHAIAPENDEMSEMNTPQNLKNLFDGQASNYQIQSFNPQNSKWTSDFGVPLSAYIFANRRTDKFPLVLETNTWQDGVVLAAGIRVSVEKRDGSHDSTGEARTVLMEYPMLRSDSVNFSFAKYVNHWLEMGIAVGPSSAEKTEASEPPLPPPIFFTNMSQELDGKVIWPGGANNARIFEYIYSRCTNPTDLSNTTSSGLGKVPKNLDLNVLVNMPPLLEIDVRFWLQELTKLRTFFITQMGCCLPLQLDKVLTDLAAAI